MHLAKPLTTLELRGLEPDPGEEWQRLLRFVGFGREDQSAMSKTVEVLLRRAPDLVVQTYDYLQSVPETAAILGWDENVDEAHLAERRRFFTVWIARTIGIDTSQEFALYLFRAGKFHAGHGPRGIHTPPVYVTGSIGMIQAAFAASMSSAGLPPDTTSAAMAGWSKYLTAQLHMMLLGYQVARDFDRGHIPVHLAFFGRLRALVGASTLELRAEEGHGLPDILRKFFNYYPHVRAEVLERIWHSEDDSDSRWTEVVPAYVPRQGWRVLRNGRNVSYNGGLAAPLRTEDRISIFPPGR